MLEKMRQQQQPSEQPISGGMQQSFDDMATRSMEGSGMKPDPDQPAQTMGTMVAGSIIGAISSAKQNSKQIPADVTLQSAMNLTQKLLSNYNLAAEQQEQAVKSVFMIAMQVVIDMGGDVLSEQHKQAFNMFMQKLIEGMQGQQAPGQPQQAEGM